MMLAMTMRVRNLAAWLIALGLACGISGGVILIRLVVAKVGHKPLWIAIAVAALLGGYCLFLAGGRSLHRRPGPNATGDDDALARRP